MKKRLFLLPLIATIGLVSCGQKDNGIPKEKYEYVEEEFNAIGIQLEYMNKGVFSTSDTFPLDELRIYLLDEYYTKQIIPTEDCTLTLPDISTTGKKNITVRYDEFEVSDVIDVVNTITFPTSFNGNDTEAPDKDYLYIASDSGRDSNGFRFADNNAYWIYKFSFDKILSEATLNMVLGNEYCVSVSNDAKEWQTVAFGIVGAGNRIDSIDVEVGLNSAYSLFGKNNGDIYVKFSDQNPVDGFGCVLRSFSFNYILSDEDKIVRDVNTFTLNTDGVNDLAYLVEVKDSAGGSDPQVGSDNGIAHRFADNLASFTFGFDFKKELYALEAKFEVRFQYKIEYSFDNSNWTILKSTTNRDNWEFVSKEIELNENTTKLYVRFSDANTADGFGCSLRNISFEYLYKDGTANSVSPIV